MRISKLILFGSQHQGRAKAESDIDLLLVSEDFRGKDIFQRAELTKDAEIRTIKKFIVPLDCIDLSPEEFENESSLAASFAKTGISIE
ncbi:MAG: nucleotidyltransferase domain-containing protein [Firmicutes bacterium]|nr:nucleotidyltransferase domain-containing protein [Bacillota bacterium]